MVNRCNALFKVIFLLILVWISASSSWAQAAPEPQTFRLIGIVEGGKFGGAVLADAKGEQTFYRLREELPDGSRITKLENDRVRVKRSDGSSYELFIIHDTKPSNPSGRPQASLPPSPPAPSQPMAGAERQGAGAGGDRAARATKSHRRTEVQGNGRPKGNRPNARQPAPGQ